MESLLEKNACSLIKRGKNSFRGTGRDLLCNTASGKKPAGIPAFSFLSAAVGEEVHSDIITPEEKVSASQLHV